MERKYPNLMSVHAFQLNINTILVLFIINQYVTDVSDLPAAFQLF